MKNIWCGFSGMGMPLFLSVVSFIAKALYELINILKAFDERCQPTSKE